MGLEPTPFRLRAGCSAFELRLIVCPFGVTVRTRTGTPAFTARYSGPLSYGHRKLARCEGVEPSSAGFGIPEPRRRAPCVVSVSVSFPFVSLRVAGSPGIEPGPPGSEPGALPIAPAPSRIGGSPRNRTSRDALRRRGYGPARLHNELAIRGASGGTRTPTAGFAVPCLSVWLPRHWHLERTAGFDPAASGVARRRSSD